MAAVQPSHAKAPSPPSFIASLSPTQQAAFADLKDLCKQHDVFWPASELNETPESYERNEDIVLLRYLRARKFNVQAAFKQYKDSAAWRRKFRLEASYDNVDVDSFESIRRLLPNWTGRRDRVGVPVFVYVVSEIRPEDLLKTAKADPDLSSIFLAAEYATEFVQHLCRKMHVDKSMARSTNVIDLSHVGLMKFWNLRTLLQASGAMATAHYPETVERIIVVGAPASFSTIWGLITRWFDPALVSKISVLPPSEVFSGLSEFIDPVNIPTRFGGSLDWKFGDNPVLDDEAKGLVGSLADGWVEGPLRWKSDGEEESLVAVGSEDEVPRRIVLAPADLDDRSITIEMEKLKMIGEYTSISTIAVE